MKPRCGELTASVMDIDRVESRVELKVSCSTVPASVSARQAVTDDQRERGDDDTGYNSDGEK